MHFGFAQTAVLQGNCKLFLLTLSWGKYLNVLIKIVAQYKMSIDKIALAGDYPNLKLQFYYEESLTINWLNRYNRY